MQYAVIWDGLSPLSIMPLRFIQTVGRNNSMLLFITKKHFIEYVYHSLLTQTPADELGCCQFWVILNKPSTNNHVQVFVKT